MTPLASIPSSSLGAGLGSHLCLLWDFSHGVLWDDLHVGFEQLALWASPWRQAHRCITSSFSSVLQTD